MAKPGTRGQRSALGIILILSASYAVWVYDTGRFSLLKAALVGPPGVTPLSPGFNSVAPPVSGATPQIMPSTPGIAPPGDHPGLPPALPSVNFPSSWVSQIPNLLKGVFGGSGDPLAGGWDSNIPAAPAYTPPIASWPSRPAAPAPWTNPYPAPTSTGSGGGTWV